MLTARGPGALQAPRRRPEGFSHLEEDEEMSNTWRWAAAIAVALALGMSACGSDSEEPEGAGAASGSESSALSGEIKIGHIVPLTGAAAVFGVAVNDGVDVAVKEINETKFLGAATLAVEEADSGAAPAKTLAAFSEMERDSSVAGVLCCVLTAEQHALKPKAVADKVPVVATAAAGDDIGAPPWMYLPMPKYNLPGGPNAQLAGTLVDELQADSAGVITAQDSDANVQDAESWLGELENKGISDVTEVKINNADTDVTRPATEIASKNPDFVFLSALSFKVSALAQELRKRGYEGLLATHYGYAIPSVCETAGSAAAGIVFPQSYSPASTAAVSQRFTEAFEAEKGKTAGYLEALGYQATYFLVDAIKRAGSADREAIAEAAAATETFESPFGEIKMADGEGELTQPVEYATFNDSCEVVGWTP
jgi:branched-chain amino acid transport system substrate-binding protein